MAISANSYGSVAGVAALAHRWTDKTGTFSITTKPTLAQVEAWIDQVSSAINLAMAQCRYTTLPITITVIVDDFSLYTNQIVAEMVEGRNDLGRLGPKALTAARGGMNTMWPIVAGEVAEYIKNNCNAFEYLGLERDTIIAEVTGANLVMTSTSRADGYSSTLSNTGL